MKFASAAKSFVSVGELYCPLPTSITSLPLGNACENLTLFLTDLSLHTCLGDLPPLLNSRPSMLPGPGIQRHVPDSDWETSLGRNTDGWDPEKEAKKKNCMWGWGQRRRKAEEDFMGQNSTGKERAVNSSCQLWATEKSWKPNQFLCPRL